MSKIVIDPRTSDVDTNIFGINKVIKRGDREHMIGGLELRVGTFSPYELHAEWIIPVGTDLLAVGTVRQDQTGDTELVPSGEDIVLVSTKPEEQIRSRNEAASRTHLPVGNPRNAILLTVGVLAVAAIVAAVILVLSL